MKITLSGVNNYYRLKTKEGYRYSYLFEVPYLTRARTTEEYHVDETMKRIVFFSCSHGKHYSSPSIFIVSVCLPADSNHGMFEESLHPEIISKKIWQQQMVNHVFMGSGKIDGMSDDMKYIDIGLK